MKRNLLRLAAATILSATMLIALGSCKKEEPEDPVQVVNLTARINVPQTVLDVADMTVTFRTSYNMLTETVDTPDWSYEFPLTGNHEMTTAMPVNVDVSLKGKSLEKGDPINAGINYSLSFDTVFESGATEHIATFEKKNAARIVWISSTGKFGSLAPLEYSWKGELRKDESVPAKYSVNALNK